ncbi:MAG: GerMN domain-containing protein [Vulcanimicrobiaceae bacterium]
MRNTRVLYLVALLVAVTAATWFVLSRRPPATVGAHVTIYYTKIDGTSEVPWVVSMRPPEPGESAREHLRNAALYAATQAVAGPPSTVDAVRFPPGTHVRSVRVDRSVATVDLSREVENQAGGTFGEDGEFKELVWTLTALPGIDAVAVRVDGKTLGTLPGGHLEIDQPLRRSDW